MQLLASLTIIVSVITINVCFFMLVNKTCKFNHILIIFATIAEFVAFFITIMAYLAQI